MATITSEFQKEVQYLTIDGDVLDLICWGYYGRTNYVTEQVLLRNRPVLTTYGAILPAGILIVLPEVTLPVAQGFRLWDYRQTVAFKALTAKIEDTKAKVEIALTEYRQRRGITVPSVVVSPPSTPASPQVIRIGDRTRIRALPNGAVVEVLGDDGVWYKQQGWIKS